MDMLGLVLNIIYLLCPSCFPVLTRWIPYFMTQGMLVIIAFNRFSAVVLYKYYSNMYKSKIATWSFLIPVTLAIAHCAPMYSNVACEQFNTTCWFYDIFFKLNSVATITTVSLLVTLYTATYVYQRFFNILSQMNEKRFLYQAVINAIFFI